MSCKLRTTFLWQTFSLGKEKSGSAYIAKSYEFCKTFGIFILPTEITREWHLPGDWSPIAPGLNNLYQPASRAVRKWRGNGERMRKWREIYSLHFLILSLFPPPLSISYIKICHILSQNVKYVFFVANVTKNLTYVLWGNNSGPNSLWGSSASCAGLDMGKFLFLSIDMWKFLFNISILIAIPCPSPIETEWKKKFS